MQKQLVSDTISFWEEYYCTVNGELHAAQSCIHRRASMTLTSLLLLVIQPLHRLRVSCFLMGVFMALDFCNVVDVFFFIMAI